MIIGLLNPDVDILSLWWIDGLAIVALIIMLVLGIQKQKKENEEKRLLEDNPNSGTSNS